MENLHNLLFLKWLYLTTALQNSWKVSNQFLQQLQNTTGVQLLSANSFVHTHIATSLVPACATW